jgi:Ser/Thr protein kinase RdoA (MazF antagonist)
MRPRNFAFDSWVLTHFDFDDICHHWFIYDIAVSAYHEIESINDLNGRTRFAINFLKDFIDGYMKERVLNRGGLLQILIFMKLRCIYAYIDYYKRLKIKWVDSGKEKMLVRRGYVLDFNSFIDINSLEAYLFTTSHYE